MRKKMALFAIFILFGCSSKNSQLSLDDCKKEGYFCYHNINFGKSKGADWELGVKDGCTTAEGEFTKNYALSSSSKAYFDGWILGRSKCKQILPNEGTIQEEINSKKRAEYEIMKLKMQKAQKEIETINSNKEENIVDAILNSNNEQQELESEY